jgi:hypothetical protein
VLKKTFGDVLWFYEEPEKRRKEPLDEIRRDMTPGERARLNSPITARQRVEKELKVRNGEVPAERKRKGKAPAKLVSEFEVTETELTDAAQVLRLSRKIKDQEGEIEHLREQLAAAESRGSRPVTDTAEVDATPLQPTDEAEHEAVTEANVVAYTARRYALADSETGTIIGDIEMVRKAYVALLPTDPKVRRQELVALANVLAGHINDGDVKQLRWELALIETLDEPDPTPSAKRRTKKKTDPAKRAGVSHAR